MSKDIIISEGGEAKALTCDKLQTAQVGGGAVTWIPEDAADDYAHVTALHVEQNGTYDAADDGAVGYSRVVVNVPEGAGTLVGTDSDGNTYRWAIDRSGNVTKVKQPSSIRIITKPSKMVYSSGEHIIFGGLQVKLYDAQGNVFTDTDHPDGMLSLNELTLPVKVASGGGAGGGEWTRKHNVVLQPSGAAVGTQDNYFGQNTANIAQYHAVNSPEVYCAYLGGPGSGWGDYLGVMAFSVAPFTMYIANSSSGYSAYNYSQWGGVSDGVYHWGPITYTHIVEGKLNAPIFSQQSDAIASFKLFASGAYTSQVVPVNWTNPATHQQFSDSFTVYVASGSGGTDTGTGGSSSGGGEFSGGGGEF